MAVEAAAAAVVVVVGFDLCIGMLVLLKSIYCYYMFCLDGESDDIFSFAPCIKQCLIFLESCFTLFGFTTITM